MITIGTRWLCDKIHAMVKKRKTFKSHRTAKAVLAPRFGSPNKQPKRYHIRSKHANALACAIPLAVHLHDSPRALLEPIKLDSFTAQPGATGASRT